MIWPAQVAVQVGLAIDIIPKKPSLAKNNASKLKSGWFDAALDMEHSGSSYENPEIMIKLDFFVHLNITST